jgi:gamma-glutamyltranspeptidase/glutathione hydrolase
MIGVAMRLLLDPFLSKASRRHLSAVFVVIFVENYTMRLMCLLSILFVLGEPPIACSAESISWNASGTGGAVAAGRDPAAVAAGLEILRSGGNAADAAAATLLALSVTDYGSFAIGGEVPILVYDARRDEVKVLCGLGRGPLDSRARQWFYAEGIPAQGSMKSAPVPGAVDAIVTLLRLYGTKSFAEVVAPTLKLLDAHQRDWHDELAGTLRKLVEAERNMSGSREQKLVAARDRFYKGDVADDLEKWYIAFGAFLRKRDLEAHQTLVEDPVTVDYRGYTVYKCGPWTQGPTLLQTLRLLEGSDLKSMGHLSEDYIHATTEALKLAFADRDEYYGDPRFVDVPLDALLSDRYTQARLRLIDMRRASQQRRPGDPTRLLALKESTSGDGIDSGIPIQDTTTCVVADRWGNFVAATPSCNLVRNRPGPSGVTQGNRIRCLNTTPNHPNAFEPGKRPRITLTPTIVTKDGKPLLGISVAGGDLQDQTTLNVLLNHIEFGMRPAEAVTAARFSTSHQENSFDPNPDRSAAFGTLAGLRLNQSVSASVRTALADRGHKVSTTAGPIAHPVMIYFDHDTAKFFAAGDPVARRHAAVVDHEDSQPQPTKSKRRASKQPAVQPEITAALDRAVIILVEAVRRAQKEIPGGRVFAAKLNDDAYEIELLAGDSVRKVWIDSISGHVVKKQHDTSGEQLSKAKRAVGETRFTMWYALDKVMDNVDFGRPFEARLNNGDYEIKLLVGDSVVERDIDAYMGT